MTRWLTDHFSLEELIATAHRGIDNTPPPAVVDVLRQTAAHMEAVRVLLANKTIIVNSGYRSPALNAAVGGAENSAHMLGWAVDFICPSFGSPLTICRALVAAMEKGRLRADQIIEEGSWVHISFDPRLRGEVLTMQGGRYRPGLPA